MRKFAYMLFFVLVISACSTVSITKQARPTQELPPVPTLVRGDLTWEESLLVSQLSTKLGVSVNDIMVAETAAVTWRDDCMEVTSLNRPCVQADIPGFRFVLVANGKQYEYHTNRDMTQILPVEDQ